VRIGAAAAGTRRSTGFLGLAILVAGSITVLAPATAAGVRGEPALPGVSPDPKPKSSTRALELLDKVASADDSVRYAGVQFVSAWSPGSTNSTVVEIKNVPGQGTAIRVRGSADGPAAAVFSTAPGDIGVQLGGGPVELLASNYSISTAGADRVTGRKTRVLEIAGDGGLVAARFWVDARTGVLLRREVYDASGRTVRASAFVQVRIGGQISPGHLPPLMPQADAEELTATEVADLRTAGCSCPALLLDSLALYRVRLVTTTAGTVLHLSYSDGLSTVSVFEQPGRVDETSMVGYQTLADGTGVQYERDGLPQQVVWSADGVVYAVVADAPEPLVDDVVNGLPHPEAQSDDFTTRIGRGLARVGSWVNPFA
jgi:sigma-E factor negative regulatory protein RseB